VAARHRVSPRDVYERYLEELKTLMRRGAGKLSGADKPYANQGETSPASGRSNFTEPPERRPFAVFPHHAA
jgi:hypothetical protein